MGRQKWLSEGSFKIIYPLEGNIIIMFVIISSVNMPCFHLTSWPHMNPLTQKCLNIAFFVMQHQDGRLSTSWCGAVRGPGGAWIPDHDLKSLVFYDFDTQKKKLKWQDQKKFFLWLKFHFCYELISSLDYQFRFKFGFPFLQRSLYPFEVF